MEKAEPLVPRRLLMLSTGEVIQIGDALTLIVLAVEDDLIHFGLESSEEGADFRNERNSWELN
jgi:hypothetical protein